MTRLHAVAIFLAAALAVASGARVPLQVAPAPAPSSGNIADVLFLIEAGQAQFTDAQTLVLSGVTGTAQSFAAGGSTAVYPIQGFANATAGAQFVNAAGEWLGNPTALLFGVANGNATQMLVQLSTPQIAPAATTTTNNVVSSGATSITNNNSGASTPTLTFTVKVLPAEQSSITYTTGAASAAVAEAQQGLGTPLVTSVSAGAALSDVVLFIDQNSQALAKPAAAEWGNGGWGNWGNGWGWNGWGWNGWGWNNGWNNGWQQNTGSVAINNNNVQQGWGWGNGPVAINNNNVGSGVAINNNNVVG